jgi:predicted RNA methylase
MKVKELEQYLSSIKPFPRPKLSLEQYATDAHIAARMVYTGSTTFDDFEGRSILDLGCGCGMLSIAALLMNAHRVLGVDIDNDALKQLQLNMIELEISEFDGLEILQADVLTLPSTLHEKFDTVILNPPFGTKDNSGIDLLFLQIASHFATTAIYTMHKTSTRTHILRKAESWGWKAQVLAQMKFEILNQFKFHKKERVYVDVDLVRLYKE